jgi:multiple sugar transport system substrate-binding protein
MEIKKIDRYLLGAALLVLGFLAVFGIFAGGPVMGRKTPLALTWLAGGEPPENGLDRDDLLSLIGEFEERNPGIRIRLESGSPAGEDGSGEENFSAGILVFDEGRINRFIRRGLLAPLGPYMDSGAGEDRRVIPLVSFMDLLFYNIDLLKAGGFDRPPKTREEFLACARAVTAGRNGPEPSGREISRGAEPGAPPTRRKGGVYGAALALAPGERLGIRREIFPWAWAAGAAIIRDGGVDVSGRPVIETLSFLGQLYAEGLVAPGSFGKTRAQKNAEFAAGNIAMMTGSVEDIPLLRKQMGDAAFGVTQIPGPAKYAGKPVMGPSFWYAGISASCEYPDEAWAFLAFLAEKSPFLAARVRAVPGSNGGPQDYITGDEFYAKAWGIYEASDLIREFSGFPRGDDLETIIREELPPLFDGKRNAADTAAAIQKRWDGVKTENN